MSFRQVTDILNASLSMYFALNLVLSESDNILMIISILITITLMLINFLHMLFTQLNILTVNHFWKLSYLFLRLIKLNNLKDID